MLRQTRRGQAAVLILLGSALAGCAGEGGGSAGSEPQRPELRAELLEMARQDQTLREELNAAAFADSARMARVRAADSANGARLEQIVEQHGWPGRSMVGADGASAAFVIAQHSPSVEFQKRAVELMIEAAKEGEVAPGDLALLMDRVLVAQGKPQIYGSQLGMRDGKLHVYPVAEPESVDVRRANVGLIPISEYLDRAEASLDVPIEREITGPGTTRDDAGR